MPSLTPGAVPPARPRPFRTLFSAAALVWVLALLGVLGATASGGPPGGFGGFGNGAGNDKPEVEVRVVPSMESVTPGEQIAIAIVFDHREGWHVHTNKPEIPRSWGDFPVIPTEIEVRSINGAQSGPIQWPEPKVEEVDFLGTGDFEEYKVFGGEAIAFLPLMIDSEASGEIVLELEVRYQACDDTTCLMPEEERHEVRLTVVEGEDAASAEDRAGPEPRLFSDFDMGVFADFGATETTRETLALNVFGWESEIVTGGVFGFAMLLLLAAVGGLVLNLTPCVLPVIPLKIMALSQAAGNPRKTFLLGLVMSAGLLSLWVGIGAAIAFIAGFDAISSLFQTGWFALLVGLFILAMGVGMLGLFTIKLPRAVYAVNPKHDTVHGSFLFGVMTGVLATPCIAPFLGTAAAWAALQPPPVTLTTFLAIGVGMALPYLVLSARPQWVSKVPKGGASGELVKQVMGLLMLAVAVFFLGTGLDPFLREPVDPALRAHWWGVAGLVALAGGWLAYRTWRLTKSRTKRAVWSAVGGGLAMAGLALAVNFTDRGPVDWEYYTPDRFERAIARGDVVVVEFTAEWCLNCRALEHAVLFSNEVSSALNSRGVTPMKVDLTGDNPVGRAKLRELEWAGIPLLAIYGPALDEPIRFGDGYTRRMVLDSIRLARGEDVDVPEEVEEAIDGIAGAGG